LKNLTQLEDKKLIIKWKHICDSNMQALLNLNLNSPLLPMQYNPVMPNNFMAPGVFYPEPCFNHNNYSKIYFRNGFCE
jgi:hypothetical protein